MKLRHFLAAGFLLAACLPVTAPAGQKAPAKPNILFIFADDLTWEGVHALSGLDIETPTLDSLVKGGTTFTHAYNSGAWTGAVCVSSRTMLNTGLQLWDAHKAVKSLKSEFVPQGRLWAQQLAKAGYTTCFAGKWHVKADPHKVFDHVRHVRPGMPKSVPQAYNRPIEGKPDPWDPTDKSLGGFWEGGKHWSEVMVDDFSELLGEVKKTPEKPWFMYLAFNATHDPRQSPKEFLDRYPLERIAMPDNYQPLYPFRRAMGAGERLRDERLAPFPRTPFAIKTHRREYFSLMTHMDVQIGRILKLLGKSGQASNTIIIFTADHGLACGHHGLMGKQNLYDHSVRVPLMIVGHGIPKNKKINAPVYLQDVMPTTLQIAGAPVPKSVAFQSLLPLIDGKAHPRKAIYGAYLNLQRMVTADGKKLILYPKARAILLYDLKNDPSEKHNLMGQPDSFKIARKLFADLQALQKQFHDNLDLTKTYPKLAGKGKK